MVKWKRVDGWTVEGPEKVPGWNALKIKVPYGLPECVLMPGDDALIPTGLWFPGLFKDFIIIPVHHTYPNKDSDVLEMWNGNLKSNPVLHFSIVTDNSQVWIHVINLGKTELRYKPGNVVSYFCFANLTSIF